MSKKILTTTTTENTNTDTNTSDTANNAFVEVQSDNSELVNSKQSIVDSPNVKIVSSIVITLIVACAVLYLIQHFFSTLPLKKYLSNLEKKNTNNENLLTAEKHKNNALENQRLQLMKELSEETNKVKLLNSNIESLKNKFDNDIKNNSNEFNNKIKNIERNYDNKKSK